ncbi:MAG: Grx4 family monothiol glutaredoxin [Buchnera aphidicola (Chaetogeoica yunlongensis)]
MNDVIKKIKNQIKVNPIIIYMKGSPNSPSCGFSSQAIEALSKCGKKFAYVDVLENPDIRLELPKYSNWPTFPQLWINEELIGGCNIILELFETGELKRLITNSSTEKNINKNE